MCNKKEKKNLLSTVDQSGNEVFVVLMKVVNWAYKCMSLNITNQAFSTTDRLLRTPITPEFHQSQAHGPGWIVGSDVFIISVTILNGVAFSVLEDCPP